MSRSPLRARPERPPEGRRGTGPPESQPLGQRNHADGLALSGCDLEYPREHVRLVDAERVVDAGAVRREPERRHGDYHVGGVIEDRAAGIAEARAAAASTWVGARLEVEARGQRTPQVHELRRRLQPDPLSDVAGRTGLLKPVADDREGRVLASALSCEDIERAGLGKGCEAALRVDRRIEDDEADVAGVRERGILIRDDPPGSRSLGT